MTGQNVVQPPRGDLLNPDVIFSAPGDITVTVQVQNLPNGTRARLRVTTSGGVLTPPSPSPTPSPLRKLTTLTTVRT
jgi:hypothetical protein